MNEERWTPEDEQLFGTLQTLLQEIPEPELPEGFQTRLMERFERVESGAEQLPELPAELLPNGRAKVVVLTQPSSPPKAYWVRPFLAAAAAVLLFFGVSLGLSQKAPDDPGVEAVLAHAEEPVEVLTTGTSTPVQAEETLALKPGSVLRTEGDNFSVVVIGETGNEVRVGGDTEVKVKRLARRTRDSGPVEGEFELTRGRVWVTETSAQLAVRTPHALLIPVGTEYEAISEGGKTEVVVWEGEVIAQSLDGKRSLRLKEGQEVSFGQGQDWTPARVAPIREGRENTRWNRRNRALLWAQRPGLRKRLQPAPQAQQLRSLPGLRKNRPDRVLPGANYPKATPKGKEPNPTPLGERLKNYPGAAERLKKQPELVERLKNDPALRQRLRNNPAVRQRLKTDPAVRQQLKTDPAVRQQLKNRPGLRERLKNHPGLTERLKNDPALRQRLKTDPAFRDRLKKNTAPGRSQPRLDQLPADRARLRQRLDGQSPVRDRLRRRFRQNSSPQNGGTGRSRPGSR